MISVKTTEEQRLWAKKIAEPLIKKYNNRFNSIRKGQGHYIAKLAERVVCEKLKFKHIDTVDSDTEVQLQNGQGRKIEVKVVERNCAVRSYFNAHVAAYNTKQKCDYYLFCSTEKDKVIHICTIMPKELFLQIAHFAKKGEKDGPFGLQNSNGFPCDCYNLPYNHPLMKNIGKTKMPC